MLKNYLTEVSQAFGTDMDFTPFGGGHINDTYITTRKGAKCVVQRLNTNVFKNPDYVMNNIFGVTSHLRSKIKELGGNPDRETLHFLKTADDKPYYTDPDGDCYRAYIFVEDSESFDTATSPTQMYEAAKAFGRFQNMLADFPAEKLNETIKEFHTTPVRVQQLKDAIKNNLSGRLSECKEEVEYALSQAEQASIVCDAMKEGTVPCRVTHNDTKLNNVLFDTNTGLGLCVIDLDTIMPGSLLYDFGDALRFGANTAVEDETDLDKVTFDLELFEAYTKGYAAELKDTVTPKEKELLAFSAKLLTYECGIRFLADFLNGDTYFKVKYPTHNLDRARNQLKLCRDIDAKMDAMNEIVKKYF